jgi:hypothetical protein
MAAAGTPDWWLDRLYKCLRDRQPRSSAMWDDWYTGRHPAPQGYEKADAMLLRLLETIGLNMLALVTDAALDRHARRGLQGRRQDQRRRVADAAVEQLRPHLGPGDAGEDGAVRGVHAGRPEPEPRRSPDCHPGAPRAGDHRVLPGHDAAGSRAEGVAGRPRRHSADLGDGVPARPVEAYAAPTRIYAQTTNRSGLALNAVVGVPGVDVGANPLGEVPLVPFANRSRMLKAPEPEFAPAIVRSVGSTRR